MAQLRHLSLRVRRIIGDALFRLGLLFHQAAQTTGVDYSDCSIRPLDQILPLKLAEISGHACSWEIGERGKILLRYVKLGSRIGWPILKTDVGEPEQDRGDAGSRVSDRHVVERANSQKNMVCAKGSKQAPEPGFALEDNA